MTAELRISSVAVTPVALPMKGTLHHSDGEIPPWQVRHVVELHTNRGITGIGDASPRVSAEGLERIARSMVGEDPFQLERLRARTDSQKFYRMDIAAAAAALETACLDIQGRYVDKPVAHLLGGTVRDRVPVIGYLFRKTGANGYPDVLNENDLVAEAQRLVDQFGFATFKYKAGALPPAQDLVAADALREAFPDHRLRIDPNGAWSAATAVQLADRLKRLDLEWVEDPCMGMEAMSEFMRRTGLATATNMCCIQPREIPLVVAARAVNVVLHDLWYIGGPWSARHMAATCRTFGLGVGIHAGGGSAETGIGLAAQAQLAASLPGLVHAMDTMHYELVDDVTTIHGWSYTGGSLVVPDAPGLGIELDPDKLDEYGESYRRVVAGELSSDATQAYPSYPQY